MKIFDLEYLISSAFRKIKAKVRIAFQKKQLSASLFLRILSILVITVNVYFSNSNNLSYSSSAKRNAKNGVVLSRETKAVDPVIPAPVRVEGSVDFDGFLGKSALVMDATTSAVFYEKNSREKLAPASLTKMMTALVVLDYRKFSDEIKIDPSCTTIDGKREGFKVGQSFTVESLLYALLLPSASDAACALSASLPIPGPEASPSARFVSAMNAKAEKFGMQDTRFTNSVGLDEEAHYSTASDLIILSRKFLEDTNLQKMAATYKKKIVSLDGKFSFDLVSTNELLIPNSGFVGIKTGYTEKALGCLSFLFNKDERQVIGVILGSPDRFADAHNLVDWIFRSYKWE